MDEPRELELAHCLLVKRHEDLVDVVVMELFKVALKSLIRGLVERGDGEGIRVRSHRVAATEPFQCHTLLWKGPQ